MNTREQVYYLEPKVVCKNVVIPATIVMVPISSALTTSFVSVPTSMQRYGANNNGGTKDDPAIIR